MKDVPRLGHTVQVLIKKLRVCHYVMDSVLWGASGGVFVCSAWHGAATVNRRARNAENENISRISALLLDEALDTNVRMVEERKGRKKVGREMVSWAVRLCEKVRTCDVCCEMRKNLWSVYCMYLLFGLGLG
ncbi:hypothetical protein U1Q18_050636 [Sarracenia purpurea var. burkii]